MDTIPAEWQRWRNKEELYRSDVLLYPSLFEVISFVKIGDAKITQMIDEKAEADKNDPIYFVRLKHMSNLHQQFDPCVPREAESTESRALHFILRVVDDEPRRSHVESFGTASLHRFR